MPVLGYRVLGNICMYWVVSVSGDIFFGRDTQYCCPLISKRRHPHDNHLNCAERSSTAEHGEGSEGVGRVQEVVTERVSAMEPSITALRAFNSCTLGQDLWRENL